MAVILVGVAERFEQLQKENHVNDGLNWPSGYLCDVF